MLQLMIARLILLVKGTVLMDHFKSIIGKSPAMEFVIENARIAAPTNATILLKGETGAGKEIFAVAIQKSSPRARKPFITLNCAALPENLIESVLFGHKKGAFTDSVANTQGVFQAAHGGTLFLDEINSLSVSIQAKLLRFIETGECLAVGSTEPYNVDVRIIAATNADLSQQVTDGFFRRDLYFRLNVVPLELPSLVRRVGDIEILIKHFMKYFETELSVDPPKFSSNALKVLKSYHWPGNVRELRNLCERLCYLLPGETIESEHLPEELKSKSPRANGSVFTLPATGIDLDQLEASLIQQALAMTNGNQAKSARLLGMTRHKLLYRVQKLGLEA
jgi:DNA-binding NtrC family response regulator